MEKTWKEVLDSELSQPYMQDLAQFLAEEEKRGVTIFPPKDEIFNAFALVPFSQVKVVIMGQDPYHGPGQAHGLSFSVKPGVKPPPSLQNIFKEIQRDLGLEMPCTGCLEAWAKQGVLLLNATLTVRARQAGSHQGRGWERFTDAVVKQLAEREDPVIFVLWGRYAKEKCEKILKGKSSRHFVLTSPHPSPFSAHTGFIGCGHFSKINDFLKEMGKDPISWEKLELEKQEKTSPLG